ncbi:MAG: hypothetical protein LBK59_06120 [Bifidobacteriaceae bacterium]|nr:hypothetical protein [Bifidobacteriaceae bacterium]
MMMLVDENRAWAAKFAERCEAVADEIAEGVLPFDWPGCFADELLMGMCLDDARAQLDDMPELFDEIPARGPGDDDRGDDDDSWVHDDDWDAVSDGFDDRCRWNEWEVPVMRDYPLLPAILAAHHPFTWFDQTMPSDLVLKRTDASSPGARPPVPGAGRTVDRVVHVTRRRRR